ncbi:MAG: WecB/TagA/CpsF family glycosyltransferase [Gammaproteobacteria bacterium]
MKKKFAEYVINDESSKIISREILSSIETEERKPKWLATINPHSYVTSQSDHKFSIALKNSDWLVPDGIGIVIFSTLYGSKLSQRVTGWDIFSNLNKCLNQLKGKTVFFLGSTNETLSNISIYMKDNYPQIKVVGMLSPPFKEEFNQKETEDMIKQINLVSPDVLWVGLTAPKQEKWIYENINNLNISFAAAIGAVFDFCAGNVSRAPKWVQDFGLEWLHRSLMSPTRLGKRNFTSNPIFVFIIIKKWMLSKIYHK